MSIRDMAPEKVRELDLAKRDKRLKNLPGWRPKAGLQVCVMGRRDLLRST